MVFIVGPRNFGDKIDQDLIPLFSSIKVIHIVEEEV